MKQLQIKEERDHLKGHSNNLDKQLQEERTRALELQNKLEDMHNEVRVVRQQLESAESENAKLCALETARSHAVRTLENERQTLTEQSLVLRPEVEILRERYCPPHTYTYTSLFTFSSYLCSFYYHRLRKLQLEAAEREVECGRLRREVDMLHMRADHAAAEAAAATLRANTAERYLIL